MRPFLLAPVFALTVSASPVATAQTEAPTGYDNNTNGFVNQSTFAADRTIFERRANIVRGLGPVYNATSCVDCHRNPVSGGSSQVTNIRVGHFNGSVFLEPPGGSLIQDRAIDASLQELTPVGNEVRTFRISPALLGAGFIEAIDGNTLAAIQLAQPAAMTGELIQVPVLELPGTMRAGRFGWKNQHGSLVSMVSQEYLDQIGITNRFNLVENTSNGRSVAEFDAVSDAPPSGEDVNDDIFAITDFIRATKAPPPDQALSQTAAAQRGAQLFAALGCSICHVPQIMTAPVGTVLTVGGADGGNLVVPPALGDKIIHPYSDFLLHDVGTGDGIVQNGGPSSRNKVRTAPLWGLRVRNRLMHDGATVSRTDAISRHGGQATGATAGFNSLGAADRNAVLTFLNSL